MESTEKINFLTKSYRSNRDQIINEAFCEALAICGAESGETISAKGDRGGDVILVLPLPPWIWLYPWLVCILGFADCIPLLTLR